MVRVRNGGRRLVQERGRPADGSWVRNVAAALVLVFALPRHRGVRAPSSPRPAAAEGKRRLGLPREGQGVGARDNRVKRGASW